MSKKKSTKTKKVEKKKPNQVRIRQKLKDVDQLFENIQNNSLKKPSQNIPNCVQLWELMDEQTKSLNHLL